MLLINISLFFLVILILKIQKKDIYVLSFLNFIWIGIHIISLVRQEAYTPLSDEVLYAVNFYIFFFNAGYLFWNNLKTPKKKMKTIRKRVDINLSLLIIFQVIISLYLFTMFRRYKNLLSLFGHTYARTIRFNIGLFFRNQYESYFYSFVISPILTIQLLNLITRDSKEKKVSLIIYNLLVLISFLLMTLIGMGRLGYFNLIMYMLIYRVLIQKNIKIIKPAIIVSLLIFISIVTTTIRRGQTNLNLYDFKEELQYLVNQTLNYFVGPRFFFNKLLNYNLEYKYKYLPFTFSGLIRLISFILPFSYLKGFISYQNRILQTPLVIGKLGSNFNAFPTAYYYYYMDLSYIGVVMMALISSYVLLKILNGENQNMKIYIIYLLFFTIFKTSFDSPETYVVIFLLKYFEIELNISS